MKECENIEVHGHSFVIKWINLLEYTDSHRLDANAIPTLNFNFKVKPVKRNIKFGLFTKIQGLNSAGNTFDSTLNAGTSDRRSYRSIFKHSNTSLGSLTSTSNNAASGAPLHHSNTMASITTPSSIKKEKKVSLKEKLAKSNMKNLLPLEEIKHNKSLAKNITISLDQPLYLALVFDNERSLRKNKIQLAFEISTSTVELNSSGNSSSALNLKNGSLASAVQENTFAQLSGASPSVNKENTNTSNHLQPSHKTASSAGNRAIQRSRRPSMVALNKRSFYIENNTIFQGYVPKNRRNPTSNKQFVTRFFVLDLPNGTLTYYQNNSTKNVKGEVLLKTCIVSADSQRGEIVIDSGFEIWILKPYSWDYDPWIDALSKCIIEESSVPDDNTKYVNVVEDTEISSIQNRLIEIKALTNKAKELAESDNVVAILNQILTVIDDSKNLRARKAQSLIAASSESFNADIYSSMSMDEFYDAIDEIPRVIMISAEPDENELGDSALEDEEEDDDEEEETSDLSSYATPSPVKSHAALSIPEATENELPLPHASVKRRNDVPASTKSPPSLLSFLRKNVGKDLGSISMPVTSNEPLTILQFLSESLEYASLLNKCLDNLALENRNSSQSKRKRLALVSSFALSQLSQQRNKARCLRKPFNPLLGETFELINEHDNYRFVAEKVEHKPEQIFSIFAQGFGDPKSRSDLKWEISYTVQPSSKFWGKSIELMNYGTIYLKFLNKSTNAVIETYTWTAPVTILKNLIAGERFVEPTGEVEITCVESCFKSVFEFKSAGGFFKGRSEQACASLFNSNGDNIGSLEGTWTKELTLLPENDTLWEVGSLIPGADVKYGFTKFASNLNEITEIENGFIPNSDSRLRPDVRYYENGLLDKAEEYKLKLEHDQRNRRLNKQDFSPLYFKKLSSSEYSFIKGHNSYWSKRERKDWNDVPTLW